MKNKETLEEVAEKYLESKNWRNLGSFNQLQNIFTEGAKYQAERMYSEEEVLCMLLNNPYQFENNIKEWFEQNKKK